MDWSCVGGGCCRGPGCKSWLLSRPSSHILGPQACVGWSQCRGTEEVRGTSLQSDFCSWLACQAHRTTLAVLLSSPCPSECQRQGFALLISLSLSPVPFLQFLHPPALLHSHVCILAIEALATILQVPIPETLLSLTSATGCGSSPPTDALISLHS